MYLLTAFRLLNDSLTLILLTWRIWRGSNNASKWQMGFNLAFKGLKVGKGYAVAQLVAALRYKQEGCAFDSRWGYWNF